MPAAALGTEAGDAGRRRGAGVLRRCRGARPRRRRGEGGGGAVRGRDGEAGTWLKVKPVHNLDLVVLAAEWGHGRRKGWLSNLHLGARDPANDGHVMLGKTFKGLTDELLAGRRSSCWRWKRAGTATPSTCARSSSWRSRSTACRRAHGTRRHGAAVRAGDPLPARQDRRRGGHDRHGPSPAWSSAVAERPNEIRPGQPSLKPPKSFPPSSRPRKPAAARSNPSGNVTT